MYTGLDSDFPLYCAGTPFANVTGLTQQDKIKQPAGTAMCRLVGVDCFAESAPGVTRIDHIASRLKRESGPPERLA